MTTSVFASDYEMTTLDLTRCEVSISMPKGKVGPFYMSSYKIWLFLVKFSGIQYWQFNWWGHLRSPKITKKVLEFFSLWYWIISSESKPSHLCVSAWIVSKVIFWFHSYNEVDVEDVSWQTFSQAQIYEPLLLYIMNVKTLNFRCVVIMFESWLPQLLWKR